MTKIDKIFKYLVLKALIVLLRKSVTGQAGGHATVDLIENMEKERRKMEMYQPRRE